MVWLAQSYQEWFHSHSLHYEEIQGIITVPVLMNRTAFHNVLNQRYSN
jgi:hypothetical protein